MINYKSIDEIKKAVDNGITVFVNSACYRVIKSNDDYLVKCNSTNRCVGLTHTDGKTTDFKLEKFFTA